jgi:DNA mismatch repair protein MutL
LRVTGLVQRPAEASPTGRAAYLFVNGRPFRDPFLVRAAERGYRATVPAGSRPSVILVLEVPPADVDVNVHPAKLEVRFRDRYGLEAAVEEAVHRALGDLVSAAPLGGPGGDSGPLPWEHQAVSSASWPRAGAAPVSPGLGLWEGGPDGEEEGGAAAAEEAGAPAEGPGVPTRILGQVHATYLLVEAPDGLLIIDQHSAHERILYERTMRVLSAQEDGAQKLLFPLTLQFTPAELDAVEAHADLLARLGYEIEAFGGTSLIVHAVPAPHARFDAERCLRDVVADLAGGRFGGLANPLERFASTFACRAAIKAGQALTEQEMRELVDRLFASELPAHDVHGRPTIVQLPRAELERRFGRR